MCNKWDFPYYHRSKGTKLPAASCLWIFSLLMLRHKKSTLAGAVCVNGSQWLADHRSGSPCVSGQCDRFWTGERRLSSVLWTWGSARGMSRVYFVIIGTKKHPQGVLVPHYQLLNHQGRQRSRSHRSVPWGGSSLNPWLHYERPKWGACGWHPSVRPQASGSKPSECGSIGARRTRS